MYYEPVNWVSRKHLQSKNIFPVLKWQSQVNIRLYIECVLITINKIEDNLFSSILGYKYGYFTILYLLNQINPVKVSSLNDVIAPLLDKVG